MIIADLGGFEPPAFGLEVQRPIQSRLQAHVFISTFTIFVSYPFYTLPLDLDKLKTVCTNLFKKVCMGD